MFNRRPALGTLIGEHKPVPHRVDVVRVVLIGGDRLLVVEHRRVGVAHQGDRRTPLPTAAAGERLADENGVIEVRRIVEGQRNLVGIAGGAKTHPRVRGPLIERVAGALGIGDYLEENEAYQVGDYVLAVPVHTLAETIDYLTVLDGHPQCFRPGERFAYNNGGFVVLALLAERATGTKFVDLVQQRVCEPANMANTAYLPSDALPERTARATSTPRVTAAISFILQFGAAAMGCIHHGRRRSSTVDCAAGWRGP